MSPPSIPWSDRLRIFRHELTCAAIVVSDFLESRSPTEADWDRIALALRRLLAIQELP